MNKVYNFYSKLKAKDKMTLREQIYTDICLESICNMFRYTCENKELERMLNLKLEFYLRVYGKCAFTIHEGSLVFGRCHYASVKDGKGVTWWGGMDGVVITLEDGTTLERKLGKDAVIIRNNVIEHSETNLFRFCQQLSEVDLSQIDLLINARSHPIILCKDDNTAQVIREAIENNATGKPMTISSTSLVNNDLLTGSKGVEVLTTTDPQTATLFQYYSHYHLDLVARLYGQYGLSTNNTGKMAQTNDAEVKGSLASSMCIPMGNYHCRLDALEELEYLLGIKIDIEFGECWKNQVNMLNGFDKEEFDIVDDPQGEPLIDDNEPTEEDNEPTEEENKEDENI